jgi:hypothetical protein
MKTYKDINGTNLKIEIYYYKGGMSFTTYKKQERGFYLSVTPVKRETNNGYVTESFMAFSGVKTLLKEVSRFSEGAYKQALELGKPKIDELVEFVLVKNNLK